MSRFVLKRSPYSWMHAFLVPLYEVVQSDDILPPKALVFLGDPSDPKGSPVPPEGQPISGTLGRRYDAVCALEHEPGASAALIVLPVYILGNASW